MYIVLLQIFFALYLFYSATLAAAEEALADEPNLYAKSVQPLLQNKCYQCHSGVLKLGNLSLETREDLLRGGSSGPIVNVGHSDQSLLIQLVSGKDPKRYMPLAGDKLTPNEIQILRDWIDGGLVWNREIKKSSGETQSPLKLRNPPLPEPFLRKDLANPIDLLLQSYFQKQGIDANSTIEDRLFIRRVYLDVLGLLPEPESAQSFIDDINPDKRESLIEDLLNRNREYAEHWMSVWNDWLRNAYRGTGFIDGGRKQITEWLYQSLRENKPYNQLVSELIRAATGAEGYTKGIIWRGVVNSSQRPEMQAAQNISQVFLGINLKCASCHDSFVNQWKLKDSYGLASVFAEKPLEIVRCDKPTGKIAEVKFIYPELGAIDSNASVQQRREQLAKILTSPENGRFARTIVNRLWANFFGRGLIEPLDDMDTEAWSPEVLDWLAYDLANHGYDLKRTMKWILTSQAYQRAAVDPAPDRNHYIFHGPLVRRLSAEQFVDAVSRITGTSLLLPEDFFKKDDRDQSGQGKGTALCENDRLILFSSGKVRSGTVPIQIDLKGSTRIHLVAVDHEEGELPTEIIWSNPQFIQQNQHQLLTNSNEIQATVADGNPPTLCESPLGGKGISTHSNAIMSFTVPTEYQEFSCTVVLPATNSESKSDRTFELFVLADDLGLRAVHQNEEPLQNALGRTNREQVVTRRDTTATTLQSLELSNGKTLYRFVKQGVRNFLSHSDGNDSNPISQLFWKALGRNPNEEERAIAENLIQSSNRQEGFEDWLWIVVMLPEFQLIH